MSLEQNVLIVVITNGIINVYFFQFIIDPNIDSFAYKSRCCIWEKNVERRMGESAADPKVGIAEFLQAASK